MEKETKRVNCPYCNKDAIYVKEDNPFGRGYIWKCQECVRFG